MIIPLYPRFIATSVGAGVPRGSPCPPAAPDRYSPIPRRRSTDTDRPRPPRTSHPARSEARTGARGHTTLTQPPVNPRKSRHRRAAPSIVTRLSQDSTLIRPLRRASGDEPRLDRHHPSRRDWHDLPDEPPDAHTRATRRHSRNPAPAPGLDSRPMDISRCCVIYPSSKRQSSGYPRRADGRRRKRAMRGSCLARQPQPATTSTPL